MIPLAAVTATAPRNTSPLLTSVYAGIVTAIIAAIVYFVSPATDNIFVWLVTALFIGAGPVLGYAIATGNVGGNIGATIGGIIGNIPVLQIILWPLLVGLLSKFHSFGRMFLANLISLIIGIVVFFIVETIFGQDPAWFWPSLTIGAACWGGSLGAFMSAWANE